MSVAAFQPIHHPELFSTPKNSRPNSSMSFTTPSTTDSSENESHNIVKHQSGAESTNTRNNKMTRSKRIDEDSNDHYRDDSISPPSLAERVAHDKRILLRRSSSAMRVRELRDVLTKMTEEQESENNENGKEARVTGSQKARLLVASQQCLVSRLQDLRHEMESMDNEVTRVKTDIVNSRRYFSAMMGIPCGPEWHTARQTDSTFTSPTSFASKSTDISPYSSDNDNPTQSSSSSSSSYHHHTRQQYPHHQQLSSTSKANNAAFQQLQQFKVQQQQQSQQYARPRVRDGELSRSDSCSSFTSWRSETEMASLFPDDNYHYNRSASNSPQVTPRTVRQRISPLSKE